MVALPYREAEALVAEYLTRAGWQILARNYRSTGFELDLVATKGQTLAVIEVKSRSTQDGHLVDWLTLVTVRKKRSLLKGAQHFHVHSQGAWQTIRFDLAVVERKWPVNKRPAIWYFVGFFSALDKNLCFGRS